MGNGGRDRWRVKKGGESEVGRDGGVERDGGRAGDGGRKGGLERGREGRRDGGR